MSRRYRAGLTAVASAAGATLLAAVVAPRASWDFWTEALWKGEGLGNAAYTFNQSIYALLARLSAPADPSTLLWAALVLIAVGYGFWRARRAALIGDEVVGLTLAGIVGSLASPITWAHHLYWFVPALIVLVDAGSARRWWPWALAGLVAFTVGTGLVSWFEQGLPEDPWGDGVPGFLIRNWYLLLCVALLVVLPIRPTGSTSQGAHHTEDHATVR